MTWRFVSDVALDAGSTFGALPALASSSDTDPSSSRSYHQLAATILSGAAALRRQGLECGSRVVLRVPRSPAWLQCFFAVIEAGLVPVLVPDETPPDGVIQLAEQVAASAILVGSSEGHAPSAGRRLSIRADRLLAETPSSHRVTPAREPTETALIAFTSGSTGRPLAVELSHAAVLWNLRAVLEAVRPAPGESALSMLPPAHLFELVVGQLCPIACGARIVYATPLLPNRVLEAFGRFDIVGAAVVPALLELMFREALDPLLGGAIGASTAGNETQRTHATIASFTRSLEAPGGESTRLALIGELRRRFPSLRVLVCGGAALDPSISRLCTLLGIDLVVGYGLTEAGPVVSLGHADRCPPRSVGRPLTGVDLRIDAAGEVLVRTPSVMRGYFGDPDATSRACRDGWLFTGDRGGMDERGFLTIEGRIKETIVTAAGTTLHPEQFESYYSHPLFAELCVVPVADAIGNDQPVLVVVPAQPDITRAELEEALRRCRTAAPPLFRVVTLVPIATPLPRTPTGKVRRRWLAEWLTTTRESVESRDHFRD